MNAPTDWTSAIAILVAGVILGFMVVLYFKRKGVTHEPFAEDLELSDLEAKRDALVRQLRDLDEHASADERQRLELETAEVLRRIDERRPLVARVDGTGKRPPSTGMNPVMKGYLWGVVSVAALVGLGYFVMQAATPREEGGVATGGIEGVAEHPSAAPSSDPVVVRLESAVQQDPENLQLRNDLAQAYLERNNLMAVFEQTRYVLEKSPNDSRALTFQALVRLAMGESDTAVQMLQQATKSDPKNLDGWVSLAWVYAQTDRMDEAEAMIAEAISQSPSDKAQLDQVFASMKQHVADAKNAPPSGAMPADHPPVQAGAVPPPPPASPPAAGGRAVTVTLDLDPAAPRKNGIVFVMARGPAGGPPVAVKRLQVASFPVTFELGPGDSMMGQPLPDSFRLEARLDADGDAMTKAPTDLNAGQAGVMIGSNVRLALK